MANQRCPYYDYFSGGPVRARAVWVVKLCPTKINSLTCLPIFYTINCLIWIKRSKTCKWLLLILMLVNLNLVLKLYECTVSLSQLFTILWVVSSYNKLLTSINSDWLLYKKISLPIGCLNKTYKDLPRCIPDYKKWRLKLLIKIATLSSLASYVFLATYNAILVLNPCLADQ